MKTATLIIALTFFVVPPAFAGEIRVYDANGQFLGIYLGGSAFYVPSVNAAVDFDAESGEVKQVVGIVSEAPECSCDSVFYIHPAHLGVLYPFHLIYNSLCGKFYISVLEHDQAATIRSRIDTGGVCVTYTNPSYEFVRPLLEVQLPFSVPISLPMRTEYVTEFDLLRKGDLNFDGDVDGADLADFAKEFGK
ncbi:MAG: hypothetical protein JRI77_08000 [Deltaproteobacteria bacterium]|nr:hypothetical protein [Deltaproteobacteria bacterium]